MFVDFHEYNDDNYKYCESEEWRKSVTVVAESPNEEMDLRVYSGSRNFILIRIKNSLK